MELLAAVMLIVGLAINKHEPRHLQTTLSDGTVVLVRVSNTDNAGKQALARVKRDMLKSGSNYSVASADNWLE